MYVGCGSVASAQEICNGISVLEFKKKLITQDFQLLLMYYWLMRAIELQRNPQRIVCPVFKTLINNSATVKTPTGWM